MNDTENAMEKIGHELKHLKRDWWWFLVMGITFVLLGTFCIVYSFMATVFAITFIGVLLLISGVAQIVGAFWAGKWEGFLLHLLLALLYVIVGFFMMDAPVKAAAGLTLLLAAFFIVGGVFRMVASIQLKFPGWPWALLSGFISLLLGLLIWKQMPESGLWVIGLFIGIEMLFNGWGWVMLGLEVRNIQEDEE